MVAEQPTDFPKIFQNFSCGVGATTLDFFHGTTWGGTPSLPATLARSSESPMAVDEG